MQCVRCGGQNKASNDYCESCGAPLGIKCDACNHVNGPTSRFCGQCSAALAPSSAGSDPSSQRILRSLSNKGGERKRLTLLFADIRREEGGAHGDRGGSNDVACGRRKTNATWA